MSNSISKNQLDVGSILFNAHLNPDMIASGTPLLTLEFIKVRRPFLTTTPKLVPEEIHCKHASFHINHSVIASLPIVKDGYSWMMLT